MEKKIILGVSVGFFTLFSFSQSPTSPFETIGPTGPTAIKDGLEVGIETRNGMAMDLLADFDGPTDIQNFETLMDENSKFGRFVNAKTNIEIKEAFLFDSQKGKVKIVTKGGKGYLIDGANYNLVSDQLFVPIGQGKVFTFNNQDIRFFEKNGEKFIFLPDSGELHEVVYVGESAILFKKFKVTLKPATENPMTKVVTKSAYYDKEEILVVKVGDDFVEVPNNKKKFAELFPEHSAELLKFIKDNKISLKDSEQVKRVASYYDTL
ncbi:hypothetical protein [Mangrovimonas sp. ST2L15]|uniref:hypothetical protein n=1 Tax=Mangrovimonas sp. ST2L15 TaxID=1645916 RepID=UPI0006B68952|nr:hypothetical protein [Mangrovimonas sp. ST2L15]